MRWLTAERGYRLILDEVHPAHPQSLIGLGAVRDRFGETEEAIALTKRALELDPRNASALQTYGRLLFNTGRVEQGMEMMEMAED